MTRLQTHALPEFDEDGFLINPAQWDDRTAEYIARMDGLHRLTREHWAVIHALRDHYIRYGAVQGKHSLQHVSHLKKGDIDRLFNHDFREACRIAGISNPGEEAKAYM